MNVSAVNCHNLEPNEVTLIKLSGNLGYCLDIDGVKLFASLDVLAEITGRAFELVAQERGEIPRHDNGGTAIDVLGRALDRNGNVIRLKSHCLCPSIDHLGSERLYCELPPAHAGKHRSDRWSWT